MKFRFFDSASTTRCCEAAVQAFRQFAVDEFGNPSSAHAPGQRASRAIREARQFFAETFRVEPDQVVFTGSGTEADNLALSGVALKWLENPDRPAFRVLASATDHPAVRKTALSLASFGAEARLLPVDRAGQLRREEFLELLTPSCALCSVQQVNNITGAVLPVEELAALAKERVPGLIFHTDAVQAFGKLRHPSAPSAVDLVSLSAHKISGPKGVGALIVLNRSLLKPARLRPLLWGGDQEMGWRSGTPNPGLIAGFHAAARLALSELERNRAHAESLRAR
ncbi:MAG: aminotransferase class V-fold PLP-dependent enzyme, partial [Oligoflexia bacterium]|nr:aminotransferase class V-fold PLP-dependent enzyme [Oligoflexia bacterium]